MNRISSARLAITFLSGCLLVLAAGYQQRGRQIADQADELLLLRTRVETQTRQIRDASVYVPWLEESLARYEHGTPAEWRDFAGRLEARRLRENRERAAKVIGKVLRPRYEGGDGTGVGMAGGEGGGR